MPRPPARASSACASSMPPPGRVGIVKPQVVLLRALRAPRASPPSRTSSPRRAQRRPARRSPTPSAATSASTMDAYGEAWLTPGSPLEADAMTANPFLGVGSLDDTFDLAERHGKGVFVLAATSNPEAFTAQRARSRRRVATVVGGADRRARSRSATPRHAADGEWASIGFVIGATVDSPDAGLPALSARSRRSSRRASATRAPGPPISPRRFGELAPLRHREREPQHPRRRARWARRRRIEARASEYRVTMPMAAPSNGAPPHPRSRRATRGRPCRGIPSRRRRAPRARGARRRTSRCASSRRRSCCGARSPTRRRPPARCG